MITIRQKKALLVVIDYLTHNPHHTGDVTLGTIDVLQEIADSPCELADAATQEDQ